MTSVVDIRPTVEPLPLSQALQDLNAEAFLDACGDALSASQLDALKVNGATVSSLDYEARRVFVAIPGLIQHGVHFAATAQVNGASVLLTDVEEAELVRQAGVNLPVVVVTDPRSAVAPVSRNIYGSPAEKLKTVAVARTNGKTTISFLTCVALGIEFVDLAICGMTETRISGLRFRSDQTIAESPVVEWFLAVTLEKGLGAAVVEISSHALSFGRVDGITFDVVAFTNLQHDHLDYYGEMESYYAAKKMLFTPAYSKRGVVRVDNERGQRLAKEADVPIMTVVALSEEETDWTVRNVHPDQGPGKITFELVDPEGVAHPVVMLILGEVNMQNTAVAIVAVLSLGYDTDEVIAALERAEQIPGRMQRINPGPRNQPLVIVDCVHTPEALEWTLRSTRDLTAGRLVIVFGTDGDCDASKCEVIVGIAAREADVLWTTDENPCTEDPQSIRDYLTREIKSVCPDLSDATKVTSCRRDTVRKTILAAQSGDTVIVTGKGSERYQDIEGIKHEYNDMPAAREVLTYDLRSHVWHLAENRPMRPAPWPCHPSSDLEWAGDWQGSAHGRLLRRGC